MSDTRLPLPSQDERGWIEREVEDVAAPDAGERFDPFCHTIDGQGRALCFADVRGRRVHNRVLPSTGSSSHHPSCQTCGKVICPTCIEIEYRLPESG